MGDPVGYKFFPGENCIPFVSKEVSSRSLVLQRSSTMEPTCLV